MTDHETISQWLDQFKRGDDQALRLHIRRPHCNEAMDVANMETGRTLFSINHFELTARLGVGGFGTV
jgi:hypothetical protein